MEGCHWPNLANILLRQHHKMVKCFLITSKYNFRCNNVLITYNAYRNIHLIIIKIISLSRGQHCPHVTESYWTESTVYILCRWYIPDNSSWGKHGAHLGPVGPSWAPCWPHEPCCQGFGKIALVWHSTICILHINAVGSYHLYHIYEAIYAITSLYYIKFTGLRLQWHKMP